MPGFQKQHSVPVNGERHEHKGFCCTTFPVSTLAGYSGRCSGMCLCWARCTKGLNKSRSSSCSKSHWQGSRHIPAALTCEITLIKYHMITQPQPPLSTYRLKPAFQWAKSSYPHCYLSPEYEKEDPSPRAFRAHESKNSPHFKSPALPKCWRTSPHALCTAWHLRSLWDTRKDGCMPRAIPSVPLKLNRLQLQHPHSPEAPTSSPVYF